MTFPRLYGRLLIALPGIAVFLAVIFRAPRVFSIFLFSALSVLAAWEAGKLCCSTGLKPFSHTVSAFLAGISALFISIEHPLSLPVLLLPGAVVSLCVMVSMGARHSRRRMAGTAALISYYAIGFGIMGRLFLQWGPWSVLAVLALCWIGDSAAYFTGIAFGKHKLMPGISPKKSWEGFYGGIVGSIAGSALAGYLGGFTLLPFVALGLFGGVAGVFGDLFESALKRDAGVKDSSGLLLGHGGFLDRFDSAVAAAPVALVVFTLFGISL